MSPRRFPKLLARMSGKTQFAGELTTDRIRERTDSFGAGHLFMKRSNVCVLVLVLLIATQARVHAYTDPGTGTLIWQMLLAASFGVMFYLRRILTWVRKLRARDARAEEASATTSEQKS